MTREVPYYIGVDLGQARDYTAVAVIEQQVWAPQATSLSSAWQSPSTLHPKLLEQALRVDRYAWPDKPALHLRQLQRFRGAPYPRIVTDIVQMIAQPPYATAGATVVVDGTGVGAAVVDLFRAAGIPIVAVQIHGGDAVTRGVGTLRVPKRDLAGSLQSVLQTQRLVIAAGMEHAQTFKAEAQNFKVKINPETAHDSYSAWREADHDDLVLAVAMATWFRDWSCRLLDNAARRNVMAMMAGSRA